MRKLILTEWVSLDGFTSAPDNNMSFVGESFNDDSRECPVGTP